LIYVYWGREYIASWRIRRKNNKEEDDDDNNIDEIYNNANRDKSKTIEAAVPKLNQRAIIK